MKSEYVQHLTQCQEKAQEGLRNANSTIHSLQNSLHQQEKVQSALNERIQSMQEVFENNDRQLKSEIKQMQNFYQQQLHQAQQKEELSAQEMNLQYLVAENHMNSTIASLRTHLTESQAKEKYLESESQAARPERPRPPKLELHLYRLHHHRIQ